MLGKRLIPVRNQFPGMLDQMVILMDSPDEVRRNIKLLWVKPDFVTISQKSHHLTKSSQFWVESMNGQ